ncbi:uncharacterized protein RAG0_15647 [Rhynchosporium agropyri]|uniref:Uncharacterized protein n=1 Tax=Rhynchosporium agropyri TaxID=914238 RepID=A0A1E1LM20_9HELO|nr:uncharacterized protein RAG0_15647 [Rhynchosporium agropyri]
MYGKKIKLDLGYTTTQLTFDKLTHSNRANQEAEIKTVNMIRPRGSNGPLSSKASATDA